MAIIVQKFGGSSLQSPERIKKVAARARSEKEKGNDVVVVVSAMGDQTNELMRLCQEVNPSSCGREKDLLLSTGEQVSSALMALALQELGVGSVAMTGQEAGIETEYVHGNAKIKAVHTRNIQEVLDEGKIAVVAGFQGCAANGEICTLGRGGSDTTAAALAAALKADRCEIFTDVDGVYTADPRIISGARKIHSMDYDQMQTMAEMGAGVIHPRAVRHAQKHNIPLVVRSSFTLEEGTVIHDCKGSGGGSPAIGMTYEKNLCLLRLNTEADNGDLFHWLDEFLTVGTSFGWSGKDETFLAIRADHLDRVMSTLKEHTVSLGIKEAEQTYGWAAIHFVFAGREEKRKRVSSIKERISDRWGEVLTMDGHPSVWSLLVPEEKSVKFSQNLYDWVIGSGVPALAFGS
ncbi:aspartate kinase [Halobacillus sp. Nhm2S1]|uniref:aspartate kinase n=1 Tax=Halobacillus sp. Nhm2S1 TaxID=2866716 RepID=UPI001C7372F7|nr:aspartate kinase [Halobacillus sp. Nhm2S1]MBX0356890.1 aspartate kinase [Halobacillus sp. Nhm2S1]